MTTTNGKILNPSGHPRIGWGDLTIPSDIADDIGEYGAFETADGRRFPLVRGRKKGSSAGYAYRVLASLNESETVRGRPVPALDLERTIASRPFEPHPWVSDNTVALMPNLGVVNSLQEEWGELDVVKVLEQSSAHQRWYMRHRIAKYGLTAEFWVTFKHRDPVADVKLLWSWSDRNDPGHVQHFGHVVLYCGEHITLDHAQRMKFAAPVFGDGRAGQGWYVVLGSEMRVGEGDGMLVSGRMLCMPQDFKVENNGSISDEFAHDFNSLRAAMDGPIYASMDAEAWEGEWTASRYTGASDYDGAALAWDAEGEALEYEAHAQKAVGYGARTYYGNQDRPQQAGDQDDFGCTNGTSVLHREGSPSMIAAFQEAAYAEAYRGVMHYETDGKVLRKADHPQWSTWEGRTHWSTSVSPDRLGKSHTPWPVIVNWQGYDRQHRSQNALAAYLWLADDPAIERLIEHYLETDRADVRVTHRQRSKARAEGRVIGTYAHFVLGCDEGTAAPYASLIYDIIVQQLDNEFLMREDVAMPVLASIGPDTRKPIRHPESGNLLPTCSAWEHGLAAIGMVNGLRALEAFSGHDSGRVIALRKVFRRVLEFLATWGCFEEGGDWYVVDDLAYFDGAPLPEPLSTTNPYIIAGTGYHSNTRTQDWTLYGLNVAATFLPAGDLRDKARACVEALLPRDGLSRREVEWLANVPRPEAQPSA